MKDLSLSLLGLLGIIILTAFIIFLTYFAFSLIPVNEYTGLFKLILLTLHLVFFGPGYLALYALFILMIAQPND